MKGGSIESLSLSQQSKEKAGKQRNFHFLLLLIIRAFRLKAHISLLPEKLDLLLFSCNRVISIILSWGGQRSGKWDSLAFECKILHTFYT